MDEEVVEISNVEKVCRLCLSTEKPRSSIFAVREHDSALSLATKIEACLSIQISTADKLSTLICADCVKNVNRWHTYKVSCLRSQDKLHEWVAKQLQSNSAIVTVKDEPVDFDCDNNADVVSEPMDNSESYCTTQILENDEEDNERTSDVVEDMAEDDNMNNEKTAKDKQKDSEKNQSVKNKDTNKDGSLRKKQDSVAFCGNPVKSEPQDDYDTDCTVEIESMTDSDLLLNPTNAEDDIVMEADSTQKSNLLNALPTKKKLRRGPHTHFRGAKRAFKQKCVYCQIFLHSKYTYMKHMDKYHRNENGAKNVGSISQNNEEELVEDLEDELVNMEKDSPLTQVQQDIISQLKTFACYSCQQSFQDRRATLSHIRQHLPDLRPYTCIACLTEFSDRSMYQLHCGASFECAMKIALVVPKQGDEKYFTCNMCLRPMQNRKELLSHLSKHSDKQYKEMMAPVRPPPKLKRMAPLSSVKNDVVNQVQKACNPYKNGDPAHNHHCDLCGMIYRYRRNLVKHRQICMRLRAEDRVSYKCAYCFMTFLVFQKFQSHITFYHKKKDFVCAICNAKFKTGNDYLIHHDEHRITAHSSRQMYNNTDNTQFPLRERNIHEVDINATSTRTNLRKYNCSICGQWFSTRVELTEHRNLHLKVKIYSCSICHSMFSTAGSLEIHMKDHGIDDPNEHEANVSCMGYDNLNQPMNIEKVPMNVGANSQPGIQRHKCEVCGKVLSSYANVKRHAKIAHRHNKIYNRPDYSSGITKHKERYNRKMQLKRRMHQCPACPKTFAFQANFSYHFRTSHLEKSQDGYPCDICGKIFDEEASLKIHKGWHNRVNSRLSTRNVLDNNESIEDALTDSPLIELDDEPPAKARKSFPNAAAAAQALLLSKNFQCQVCNDKFNSVIELRSHLWDVHCARNKPEKKITNNELQCELCTNVFPDKETLKTHMQWHDDNPILNSIQSTKSILQSIQKPYFSCDVCGKSYSSRKILMRHKKLHKNTFIASLKFQSLAKKQMSSRFQCAICRKVFATNQTLQRHRLNAHHEIRPQQPQQLYNSNVFESETRMNNVKIEMDEESPRTVEFLKEKKTFMCHLCKVRFPNMSVLYKHKQSVHKPGGMGKDNIIGYAPMSTRDGKYSCNVCYKKFPALPNLRQHFTIKHVKSGLAYNFQDSVLVPTLPAKPSPPKRNRVSYTTVMYSCKLCNRHVFKKDLMMDHIFTVHQTGYQAESGLFHKETDLSSYVVKGAVDATCPHCRIKYPNNKAMKIHYIKFHEND